MGVTLGAILVAAGILVMLIGFWKVLILAALFGIGYFIGTIDNLGEFVRDKANKIIPDRTAQPINIKNEIAREQAENVAAVNEAAEHAAAETAEDEAEEPAESEDLKE